MAFTPFTNLGTYAKSYKTLAEKNDMNLSPAIVSALDKVDTNKDPAKRDALIEAATAAITKWETAWTEETKKVANPKEKTARTEFAIEVYKMKQALHHGDSSTKTSGASVAYTKTAIGVDLMKARQGVPFGAAAAVLALDDAETAEEAKALAAIAQKALEKEAAEIDAAVKSTKDKDRKLKISEYGIAVRKALGKVKEAAK